MARPVSSTRAPRFVARPSPALQTIVGGPPACDAAKTSTTKTVSITVDPVNDAPVAIADAFSTNENAALMLSAIQITSNDTDADDDGLTLTAVSATATTHGTVSLVSGTVTYTPALNYSGAADFDYTVSDGNGGTATGHVVITVTAIGAPPNAADQGRADSAR